MSKPDEGRRAFLIGAAVGAGAAAGLVPDAIAQTHPPHPAADSTATTAQAHAHGPGYGAFFNDDDTATVAAFTERLMPGAPGKPGAKDAGVLNYIDLALSGAYADQQDFYRRGLAALDGYCRKTYDAPFAKLDAAKQDEVRDRTLRSRLVIALRRRAVIARRRPAVGPARIILIDGFACELRPSGLARGNPDGREGEKQWQVPAHGAPPSSRHAL